jgi:hypothetical protein
MNSKQVSRALKAIEAARNSAKDNYTRCMLEDIQLHTQGYAEPGYEGEVAATGNWNNITSWDEKTRDMRTVSNLPSRLARVLERLGVESEWSDEWITCYDCGKLLRTQPDSMWWKPSFTYDDNGAYCLSCARKNYTPPED